MTIDLESLVDLSTLTYYNEKITQWCIDNLNGRNGLSAYEIAVKHGFKGTEAEWLESLGNGSGEGTLDHSKLINRDAKDQHPIAAIKGLEETLKNVPAPITNLELEELLK